MPLKKCIIYSGIAAVTALSVLVPLKASGLLIDTKISWPGIFFGALFLALMLPKAYWLIETPTGKLWVQRLGLLLLCFVIPVGVVAMLLLLYINH